MSPTEYAWQRALDTSRPVVILDPGDAGFEAARSLGRLGVPVYGVLADTAAPGARSRYWRAKYQWDLSAASAPNSVEWLTDLASSLGTQPILIPVNDASCLFAAEHAPALGDAYLFPDQPSGLPGSLSSKKGMYDICRRHGIPTPETIFPQNRDDVLAFLEGAVFPVMVKGIYTFALRERTGVTMVIVEDAQSLLEAYDRMETPYAPNLMLQEYIPGGAEDVWMFNGYFDRASDCLFGVSGQKLRQYPAYVGRTSLGVCVQNEEFCSQVQGFMKTLGYRGVLDIGYKRDTRTGEYKLLDVNPRVGMSFRLFVDRVGMDVVRALYCDLTGQPVPTGAFPEGRKWIVEDNDVVSSIRYFRDGQLGVGQWLRSFSGVEEGCWFVRDDLSPFVARLSRVIQGASGQIVRSPKLIVRSAWDAI